MIWIARIATALVGLFSLALGAVSHFQPEQLAETMGMTPQTGLGLNSLQADFGAFFLASAIACGLALFAGKPRWLWGAAVMYGLALLGRLLSAATSGVPEGLAQPVIIELVLVLLLLFSARTLNRET